MRTWPLAVILAAVPIAAQEPPPAPYSVPWQLRPASAVKVGAVNQTFASFDPDGDTAVTMLTGSYRFGQHWAPLLRIAWTDSGDGQALSHGLVGVTYARRFSRDLRFSAFGGTTLLLGEGGGSDPDTGAAAAQSDALKARSQMDNALFVPNYWTVLTGADLAWVAHGVTVQGEFTILALDRVKGPDSQDGRRTNFTAGIHAGGFVRPWLSLGAEWRVQRWLSDAAPVRSDPAAQSQSTFAIGPRFHVKLGRGVTMRPGINYAFALDDPMDAQGYSIVQLDVPFYF